MNNKKGAAYHTTHPPNPTRLQELYAEFEAEEKETHR